jgi:vitamin K-dependent gamma-carboxylase
MSVARSLVRWIRAPQQALRLELIRIGFPLASLAFLAGRLLHADELLGDSGFHVPDLGRDDWRQPLYLPPLPDALAALVAVAVALSGLALAVGYRTRAAALLFATGTAWIALADRLSAFTVTKLSPTLALALFFSPAGCRYGVDAWREHKAEAFVPALVRSGALRFFQVLLAVFYCASGVCKARGDWLHHPYVLWTHLHDSYQTAVSGAIARAMPARGWSVLQLVVLGLEVLAPLWLGVKTLRPWALALFVGMHVCIGLMFGPVKWFALLMIVLLIGCYLPAQLMRRGEQVLARVGSLVQRE